MQLRVGSFRSAGIRMQETYLNVQYEYKRIGIKAILIMTERTEPYLELFVKQVQLDE